MSCVFFYCKEECETLLPSTHTCGMALEQTWVRGGNRLGFQKSTGDVKCQNAKAVPEDREKSEGAEQKSKVGMNVWWEALSSSKAKSWKTKSRTRRKQRHQQLICHNVTSTQDKGWGLGSASWEACWHKFLVCCGFFCIMATWQLSSLIPTLFYTRALLNRSHLWKSLIVGKRVCFLGKLEQAHVLVLPLVNQKQAAGCLVGLHRHKTGGRRRRLSACCRNLGILLPQNTPRTCAVPFTLPCQQLPPACPCPCTAPFAVITLISA